MAQPAEIERETAEHLREACFYLRRLGLSFPAIAEKTGLPLPRVRTYHRAFAAKIRRGDARETDEDRRFWEDLLHDSEGNMKVTFVAKGGFHHCRKTDLEAMESATLLAIFETCRQYLDFDIHSRFLQYKPPAGYDPMALTREITKAAEVVEGILQDRWKKEGPTPNPAGKEPPLRQPRP